MGLAHVVGSTWGLALPPVGVNQSQRGFCGSDQHSCAHCGARITYPPAGSRRGGCDWRDIGAGQTGSAQPGLRFSKNAAMPSLASGLSQRVTSASMVSAITASSIRGPSFRASALAAATAPGAQDR